MGTSCFLTQGGSEKHTGSMASATEDFCFEEYFKSSWFHDKEEWKQIAQSNVSHGKSIFFEPNGCEQGTWTECRINAFDAQTGKFSIVFVPSNIQKEVFRVNLMMPFDDENQFLRQRDIFFKETKLIYELVQCQRFIAKEPASEIGTLSLKQKGRVTQLVVGRMGHIPRTLETHKRMLTNMLNSIDDDYIDVMKRCKLRMNDIHTPLNSSLMTKYTQHRRENQTSQRPHRFERQYEFTRTRDMVEGAHLDSHRPSLRLFHNVIKVSQRVLASVRLFYAVETDYDAAKYRLQPPYELNEYFSLQKECVTDALDVIKFEWRQEVVQLIETSKVTQTTMPNVNRFYKRVDYVLSNQLHSMLVRAFRELHDALFGVRCADVILNDSTRLVSAIRRINQNTQTGPRINPPLIKIKLEQRVDAKGQRTILFNPTMKDIELRFAKLITGAVESLMKIFCIEGDNYMSDEGKAEKSSVPLLHKSSDVSGIVNAVFKDINVSFTRAVTPPMGLLRQYQQFANSLQTKINDLKKLRGTLSDVYVSDQQFRDMIEKLKWFGKAAYDVQRISSDTESYKVVEIIAVGIKQILFHDIYTVIKDMHDFLSQNCNKQEHRIAKEYERDLNTLGMIPENEAKLDFLWTFLSEIEGAVQDRVGAIQTIDSRLSAVQSIGYMINLKIDDIVMNYHWTVGLYPRQIFEASKACNAACEVKNKALSASLYMERRTFESEMIEIKDSIIDLTTKSEWSKENVEIFADEAHNLHERVDASLRKVADFARRERIFGWTPMEITNVAMLQTMLEPYYLFWTMSSDFTTSTASWSKTSFEMLMANELVTKVALWKQQLVELTSQLGKNSKLNQAIATLQKELMAFSIGIGLKYLNCFKRVLIHLL
ncbi:Aste57867_10014 [Aphanomyces stellatus]|uniref:Aste57867_10014 protein n=1 Tax=Aphanomyces stellatus TaxID=120398 RepID=A0A485KPA6_9STRA|nr:hypothetical protein As57867_009975 [Aphanomyces stellatus]VFT86892.1 Aste57867_10014 [Aphanomyces stellatus]